MRRSFPPASTSPVACPAPPPPSRSIPQTRCRPGGTRVVEKQRETERNGEKQRETETQRHFQVRTVARLHVRVHRILPEKQYRWYYRFRSLILNRLSFSFFFYQAHYVNGLGSRTSLAKSGTGIPAPVVSTCVMPFDRSPSRFRAAAREPMNSPGGCTGTGRPSG